VLAEEQRWEGHWKRLQTSELYLLTARATLPRQEQSNYMSTRKLAWDEWHRRFGHISISTLQQLDKEGLVSGLTINQSSIPSRTCIPCTEAKQTHQKFPQEAEHRSEVAGERFLSHIGKLQCKVHTFYRTNTL
jgi:hypothetical protein